MKKPPSRIGSANSAPPVAAAALAGRVTHRAWASLKSFLPKEEKRDEQTPPDAPGNPSVNFRGEKRSNETHASTADPEPKLARKTPGYQFSQRVRKRLEEIFGWLKTVGGFPADPIPRASTHPDGRIYRRRYNLSRMQKLGAAGP
jgi:hypothetical protein